MKSVTLRIPMITDGIAVHPQQVTREFQGDLPERDSVAFVARIIRDGLEDVTYPEFRTLIDLGDSWLVQQIELVKAVPNHVWIRNGFYPITEWELALGD